MKLKTGGFTLVELILAVVLSVIAVSAVMAGYNFLFIQTKSGIGRGTLNLQMSYAMEKIRLQCLSASGVDKDYLFTANAASQKSSFCFTGEKDPYDIDINNSDNNMDYCYYIDSDKRLILSAVSAGKITTETLIDAKYEPAINFEYNLGDEPNYFTAMITATAKNTHGNPDRQVIKKEGIRFWYTEITQ